MKKEFTQILEAHLGKHPLMEPQDFGKLVFQSEFGPEHMVSDRQQAESESCYGSNAFSGRYCFCLSLQGRYHRLAVCFCQCTCRYSSAG